MARRRVKKTGECGGHSQPRGELLLGGGAITVGQLAAMVKAALAAGLPAKVAVVGEISNFSDRTHWFFSLKDEVACIRCVCFATAARQVAFAPRDGMQVVATGNVDFYDAQGHVQLYVQKMEPVGVGSLELRFRALCEELRKLGYFDPERKKPLPRMPQCVAVVTSRTGAALADVLNTARKRWAGCRLLLMDVHVQGGAAAPEVAAAIDALSRDGARLGVEAILLTRGGGSIEDLWAFNERVVADSIYRCRLPIVAAIGHETDTTIAELVADVRCSTPTQAAMLLVPDRSALEHQLLQTSRRLVLTTRRHAEHERQRLLGLTRHPMFRRPQQMVVPLRERVERLSRRLDELVQARVTAQRDRVAAVDRHLQAVSPAKVLGRGYSYTLGPDGKVIRSPAQVRSGERIVSVLAQGRLLSRVESSEGTPAPQCSLPLTTKHRHPKRGPAEQPGLF